MNDVTTLQKLVGDAIYRLIEVEAVLFTLREAAEKTEDQPIDEVGEVREFLSYTAVVSRMLLKSVTEVTGTLREIEDLERAPAS